MPVGHVLVGNSRCYVEHNDGTLSLDVVTIAKSTEFFLPGCVPNIEPDSTTVRVEYQWMYLHAESCNVLFFKLTRHMTFDECRFAGTTITDQHAFESGHVSFRHC
uniref:Uncharacterized protein n=1 Tax=Anopheles christyi TaxID=43041 RepID=A0A182KHY9_9DIPT